MFGNNPKLPPVKGDGNFLDIVEIFDSFQGEAIYSGWPAIFIRLGGCNLDCKFCDTEFDNYQSMSLEQIMDKVNIFIKNTQKPEKMIVITGGEPFRQPIEKLCDLLISKNFIVQVETNGTLYRPIHNEVKIICSPKSINGKYLVIREDLLRRVDSFKFLISKNNKNYNFVPDVGQAKYNIAVYIQPMDEYDKNKNQENLEYMLELAKKYSYRYSLQTHKILNIE